MRPALRPTVMDDGRRPGTHSSDLIVQFCELVRDRCTSRPMPAPTAVQPSGSPAEAAGFASETVERSVREPVSPPWRRNLRVAIEGRERGKRAVKAVVATTWEVRPPVVDQLPVRMCPWVGSDCELASVAKRVLDGVLVGGEFYLAKSSGAVHP